MRTYRLEIRLIQVASVLAISVLIAGFFGLWGESGQAPAENPGTVDTSQTSQPLSNPKIVALGDSFTSGYPRDIENSWTERLAEVLQVPVINKGKEYQTAKDLLARFDQDVVAEEPGRVIIFAGIGDALQEVPLEEAQSNIKAMVEKAKENDIIPILALPIGYPGYRTSIQEIREWEMGYAQEETIQTLDFATVLFNEEDRYLEGFSDNGKYPSKKGYETMGDYAAQVLK